MLSKIYLQQCSNTSAEQAPVCASVCASPRRGCGPGPCPNFCPSPSPSKTLSDGHLLNSLLLSEKKKDIFLPPLHLHLHPFPSPPRKDCRNRTIWCCPSPLLRLRTERRAWNTLRRGEAERNEGGSVYRNIVTKKKEKENCS